jgi:hypothetical protein
MATANGRSAHTDPPLLEGAVAFACGVAALLMAAGGQPAVTGQTQRPQALELK